MIQILDMRRHSIKDGPDNAVGPKGKDLAEREGKLALVFLYAHCFVGVLPRTLQTAEAFFFGGGDPMPDTVVIREFGDDGWFAEIMTPEWKAAVKSGMSNFDALFKAHPEHKIREWAEKARRGIKRCFVEMDQGNTAAVAFGHSPIIELAAWAIAGFGFHPEFRSLSDLEGITFLKGDVGSIVIRERISVA